MGRETLGDFEQLVLLAALRLGERAYAVSIIEEIATHSGREPTHGAVYVALRRLEKRGLVTTRVGGGEASPDRGPSQCRIERVSSVRRFARMPLHDIPAPLDRFTGHPHGTGIGQDGG